MKRILILWIACAIFNWNVVIADMCGRFSDSKPREHYGIALFVSAMGPLGTIISLFSTNIYQHGFYYKNRDIKE